jgi:hypothetical protein
MASSEESRHRFRRLHDEPVSPLQLVTHIMYDEEVVPNAKRMDIAKEEVLLSHPKTVVVPPEQRGGPSPAGPLCHGPAGVRCPTKRRGVPSPAVTVL